MSYNKETGMYEGYIYKITNDVNYNVYIGQTRRTIAERFSRHILDSKNKSDYCNLYKAMNYYGSDNFHVDELIKIEYDTQEELIDNLNQNEKEYIKKYKENNVYLYNMTSGGLDHRGNTIEKIFVIQYDLFCNLLNIYPSVTEASDATNIQQSDISKCICKTGIIHSAGNYIWRKESDPLTDDDEINFYNKKYKGCCQYDYYGNLLYIFYTVRDAENYLRDELGMIFNSTSIYNCCAGKVKSCHGFIWRYKNDSFDKYSLPIVKNIDDFIVYQLDIDTLSVINIYESVSDASKNIGIPHSSIFSCCSKNTSYSNNYIWCYKRDYLIGNIQKAKFKEKPVDCYDSNYNFIKSYNSIEEAVKDTGTDRNGIANVCKNKGLKANGYIWRFRGDSIETCLMKNSNS